MQIQPEHVHHTITTLAILFLSGMVTGGGGIRFLIYLSKSLAPLPANAGWWATTFYNLLKNTSGLDPNAHVLSQHTLDAMGLVVPK